MTSEGDNALVKWLQSRGGSVHDDLDLFHPLPNGDRGVVATADIKEGEQLVLVPVNCTLHLPPLEDFKKSQEGCSEAIKYLLTHHPGLSPFIATVLVALSELGKGTTSQYYRYFRSLPPSCDCLMSWDDADKAELKGTSIDHGADHPKHVFEKQAQPCISQRPDLWPAPYNSLEQFLRVAGLVQSRAFHMEAENWVTGTKQESAELYLIPAIDMINHSTSHARRNTTLLKLNAPMSVEVEGQTVSFDSYFTMKAQRDIKAGEQVLHTYGELSDAQLLQTYGFVDVELKAGELPQLDNPNNCALVSWSELLSSCRVALQQAEDEEEKDPEGLEAAKRDFLVDCHLLQRAAPDRTEFVLTRAKPLSDELLTSVQVLLMLRPEFEELKAEWEEEQQQKTQAQPVGKGSKGKGKAEQAKGKGEKGKGKASKADKEGGKDSEASGAEAGPAAKEQAQPLSLGTALLDDDEDFAKLVAFALLQVVDTCMSRYATSPKEDARLLKHGRLEGVEEIAPSAGKKGAKKGGKKAGDKKGVQFNEAVQVAGPELNMRQKLAVVVRLGEKDVLQLLKKRALMCMMGMGLGDEEEEEEKEEARPSRKRQRGKQGSGAGGSGQNKKAAKQASGSGKAASAKKQQEEEEDEDEDDEDFDGEGESDDDDEELDEVEREMLDSDDSDKVGYGEVDYDDGPGEAHDRLKPHPAPED